MRETWGNPNPLTVVLITIARHVVSDNTPKRWGTLTNIKDKINHPPRKSSYQLAHIGIPLEVQPSNCSFPRTTFVPLDKLDAVKDLGVRQIVQVAFPERFGEVTSFITESRESHNLYLGNFQGLYLQNFHYYSSTFSWRNNRQV
jgi:hypothetical protein